jgi:predicted CoA-binding protein
MAGDRPLPGKNVVVIGATNDRSKFGNKAVRAYIRQGYKVYPVNPRTDMVEGLPAFRSILDVPGRVDIVTMYVPPGIGLALIEDVAKKRPKQLFLNPGTESDELVERARALGLSPIQACSILAVGLSPEEV